MPQIIDGKGIAKGVRQELKQEVSNLAMKGITPRLAVIMVGDNPASASYVRSKMRASKRVGILSDTIHLPETVSDEALLREIHRLNEDGDVHAILLQLPLPKGRDGRIFIQAIDPRKDADGLHPENLGRLLTGERGPLPCTPAGIMHLLDETNIDLKGARATVLGRSILLGKPMALMLLARHATVTQCHSRTIDLASEVKKADIVVAAVGQAEMIRGSWVKEGAVVIDAGINQIEDKIVGDVAYAEVFPKTKAITPVPGGVGPMTVAMLLKNTVEAAKHQGG